MKKFGFIFTTLVALGLLVYLFQREDPGESSPVPQEIEGQGAGSSSEKQVEISPQIKNKPDDYSQQHMGDYGNSELAPQKDISQVFDMLQSYFSLVKRAEPLPLGSNREITAALSGKNVHNTRVLNPQSPWINQNGELIDRWKTPLYFHAIDAKNVGIRSAGPDQKMWTSDDLIDSSAAEPAQ